MLNQGRAVLSLTNIAKKFNEAFEKQEKNTTSYTPIHK